MSCIPMPNSKKIVADVVVKLNGLKSVPLLNAVLFSKLRIINARGTSHYSKRVEVDSNAVIWKTEHKLRCKFVTSPFDNQLEPKYLKVSVRKELDGGKRFSKLGYVMLDLACFASPQERFHTRSYILESYSQKNRSDNSLLLLSVMVKTTDDSFLPSAEDRKKCFESPGLFHKPETVTNFGCIKNLSSDAINRVGSPNQVNVPISSSSSSVSGPAGRQSFPSTPEKVDSQQQQQSVLTTFTDPSQARPAGLSASLNSALENGQEQDIRLPSSAVGTVPGLFDHHQNSFDRSLERKRELIYANETRHIFASGNQQLIQATRMSEDEVV